MHGVWGFPNHTRGAILRDMKTLLLCAVLLATAVLVSSCASDSYPGGDPDLRHTPPAPATVY